MFPLELAVPMASISCPYNHTDMILDLLVSEVVVSVLEITIFHKAPRMLLALGMTIASLRLI